MVWAEGLEAGWSCWGPARAEQAPSLQQNQGVFQAEVPKASPSNRGTEPCSLRLGDDGRREGRGQQVCCGHEAWAWPHLHHWLPE